MCDYREEEKENTTRYELVWLFCLGRRQRGRALFSPSRSRPLSFYVFTPSLPLMRDDLIGSFLPSAEGSYEKKKKKKMDVNDPGFKTCLISIIFCKRL